MLYVSTRNKADTYTAHVALTKKFAPDGGWFAPFRIPVYEKQEIQALKEKTFNQIIAEVLNQFFSARLTTWDIDLTIGRGNVKTLYMNHRLMVTELWHNPVGDFVYILERLRGRLKQDGDVEITPWLKTAVWIATCFAVYGQLLSEQLLDAEDRFDVVVPADDVMMPVAAQYARKMGLPIHTIICSCSGESNLWDLIRRGTVSTSSLSNDVASGIELLLYAVLGGRAAAAFTESHRNGRVFSVGETYLPVFTDGFYCTVAGDKRADSTINSFFRSNRYVIDPPAAICYSGIQDFRAGTGSGRLALLFSEHTPKDYMKQISDATGVPETVLIESVKI